MEIEITGIEEAAALIGALDALPGVLGQVALEDGLLEAAKVAAAEAKNTTAFKDKTGALRASIRARRGKRRYKPSALVEATAPHAHLVELGTIRAPGHPFLEPAVRNTRADQNRAFARGVGKNFKKVEQELTGKGRVSRRTRRALGAD